MDIMSRVLLAAFFIVIFLGFVAFFVLWLIWRRSNLRKQHSPSPNPHFNRENSLSGTENSGKSSSQQRQRRKRYSMLNQVRHEIAGIGRDFRQRATDFSTQLESVRNALATPRRHLMAKLAKILLPEETPAKEPARIYPPSRMFEDDYAETLETSQALGILRAVRAFSWGVEKSVFQEICKSAETLSFEQGDMLFYRGSEDDSIYVVESGQVDLLVVDENKDFVIKSVKAGESIFSMTAIVERLTGLQPMNTNVAARCVAPSQVTRLPISAFCSACKGKPELIFATVQTITIKISRFVFTSLHSCLGLCGELVRERDFRAATCNVQSLSRSLSTSSSTDGVSKRRFSSIKTKREPLGFRHSSQDSSEIRDSPRMATFRSVAEVINALGEEKILDAVSTDLMLLFQMPDRSFLEGAMKLETYAAGSQIHPQDDRSVNLVVTIHGTIHAYSRISGEDQEPGDLFFTAHPGSLLGQLSIISSEPSFYSLVAASDSLIVSISRQCILNLFKDRPRAAVVLANFVVSTLSPFVRQIDHCLSWKQVDSGRVLYRQNDVAECAFVVLHGRLRTVLKKSDDIREVVSEHGRDEVIGLVELLTQQRRMFTALAVRDTEVGSIPAGLIHWLKRTHPKVVTRLIHVIGTRLADVRRGVSSSVEQPLPMLKNRPPLINLSTVAVIPASKDVPLSSFTLELQHALNAMGPTLRLTGMLVMNQLGGADFDTINEYHLQTWLSQQEEAYRMILYQCDSTCTPWSKWCMRQADAILEVALASADPSVSSQLEFDLERVAVRAQKELVLLYRYDYEGLPRKTSDWLAARGWCHGHHHIRCPKRLLATSSPNRIISTYRKLFDTEPNPFSDFSRLARYLTGTSIGLAMSGGGARGIAHIGVLKAMMEAGIPVDMVAGTSIGSLMAALWARELDFTRMTEAANKMANRMTAKPALVCDLTYPYAGMFTGRNFNNIIREAVSGNDGDGDVKIEDLWLPYACVTTDVTASKMRIHTIGSLWRYVRASMSLAGYMPPLCDPHDGHLLVDGGYINNLPADVLRAMGCSVVFTVDVGAVDDTDLTNYGDELSGWYLLWKKVWPWTQPVKVPNIADIQSRLAYVACCRQLETVKQQPYCVYVRPPIDKYKTLAFSLFDEINKVGYNYARKFFSIINVRRFFFDLYSQRAQAIKSATTAGNGANKSAPGVFQPKNFTELAEMVCRIEPDFNTIDEGDEEVDDYDNSSLPSDVVDGGGVSGGPSVNLTPQTSNPMNPISEGGDSNSTAALTVPSVLDANGSNNGGSNSRSNSRRSSVRTQPNIHRLLSKHLDDDDDDDLDLDDPVFDDTVKSSAGRSLTEQDRSLSDTEINTVGNVPRPGSNHQKSSEAESLPITVNCHLSLSD